MVDISDEDGAELSQRFRTDVSFLGGDANKKYVRRVSSYGTEEN